MNRLCFYADGGLEIGYGHIVRCASLAMELQKNGIEVIFVTNEAHAIIKQLGYPMVLYRSDASVLETVKKLDAKVVIVDKYGVEPELFFSIRQEGIESVYIDDGIHPEYNADMVINGNLYGESLLMMYPDLAGKYLFGPSYALLRPEFISIEPIAVKSRARHIFVCFGGSDPRGLTRSLVQVLNNSKDIEDYCFHVVIGMVVREFPEMDHCSDKVIFHRNPEDISQLMAQCDMALVASGSILYETARVGLPTVHIVVAQNQEEISNAVVRQGMGVFAGKWDTVDMRSVVDLLKILDMDPNRRKAMSGIGRSLVDGMGTRRCARYIVELIEERCSDE